MRAPPRADAPTSARGTQSRGLPRTVPAVLIPCMDKFIEQHADRISGTLGCFDRVLFRGYLPIMSGAAMAAFLKSREVWGETLKSFLLEQAERLKRHALDLCTREGRPYEYLSHATKKEDLARKIAERDLDYRGPGVRAVGGGAVPHVLPGL